MRLDFEALYLEHRDMIYRLSLRLLENRDWAVEATQETFTKAFKAKESFRGQSKPGTWLFRIAYNVCLTKLGGRKDTGLEGLDRPDAESTRPEPLAQSRETVALVHRALARLSEEDRRVLLILMEKDMNYDDLAYVLDCPAPALRMRVSRARRRLKELLEPMLEEAA